MINLVAINIVTATPKISKTFFILAILTSFLAAALFCGFALCWFKVGVSLWNYAFEFAAIFHFLLVVCTYFVLITVILSLVR